MILLSMFLSFFYSISCLAAFELGLFVFLMCLTLWWVMRSLIDFCLGEVVEFNSHMPIY